MAQNPAEVVTDKLYLNKSGLELFYSYLNLQFAPKNDLDRLLELLSGDPVGTIVLRAVDDETYSDSIGNAWIKCDGKQFNTSQFMMLHNLLGKDTVPNISPIEGCNYYIKATQSSPLLNQEG